MKILKKNFIFEIIILLLVNITFINNQNTNEKQNIEDKNRQEAMNLMEEFSNEWETKMQDYNMEYLYYVPIMHRDEEIYFENVTSAPTTFKGAFFLSDESTDKIEFYIRDSAEKLVYFAKGHYNIFEIPIKKADNYKIILRNNLINKVVVTFTMNTGQNNFINSKDLSNTEKKMESLEAVIKKFNMEFKLSRDIHTKRYQSKL